METKWTVRCEGIVRGLGWRRGRRECAKTTGVDNQYVAMECQTGRVGQGSGEIEDIIVLRCVRYR